MYEQLMNSVGTVRSSRTMKMDVERIIGMSYRSDVNGIDRMSVEGLIIQTEL